MTTSVFPTDTSKPFVAENGVTYVYEADRWRVKQYKLDDAALEDYVTDEQFEQSQGVQDDQINALETQVQLLAQVSAIGKWKYVRNITGGSPRPPATGSFYATHKDGADVLLMNWADARLIMINKTDLEGTVFTFVEFEEGDKLEILAVDGSSACYGTVTNNPNQEAYGNLIIAVERSNGGPPQNTEKEFLLSVYRPGASNGGDLDALDHRYLKLSGGTLTGQLILERPGTAGAEGMLIKGTKADGEDGDILRVYHNSGDTPDAINYEGRQENPTNLATVQYVKDNAGGSANIPVGSSVPPEIKIGDMWFNTLDNGLYIKIT